MLRELDGFAGHTIVKQYFNSMESVRHFVRGIALSIPEDAGQDGPNGVMIMPQSMSNPDRKRHREVPSEPAGQQERALRHREAILSEQRGYELIAAMQPDVGNELLSDLDAFDIPP